MVCNGASLAFCAVFSLACVEFVCGIALKCPFLPAGNTVRSSLTVVLPAFGHNRPLRVHLQVRERVQVCSHASKREWERESESIVSSKLQNYVSFESVGQAICCRRLTAAISEAGRGYWSESFLQRKSISAEEGFPSDRFLINLSSISSLQHE